MTNQSDSTYLFGADPDFDRPGDALESADETLEAYDRAMAAQVQSVRRARAELFKIEEQDAPSPFVLFDEAGQERPEQTPRAQRAWLFEVADQDAPCKLVLRAHVERRANEQTAETLLDGLDTARTIACHFTQGRTATEVITEERNRMRSERGWTEPTSAQAKLVEAILLAERLATRLALLEAELKEVKDNAR